MENVAARKPGDRAVLANLGALKRSAAQLEQAWEDECRTSQIEICRYRLFTGMDQLRYGLKSVTGSLLDFQELFSSIYDALQEWPQKEG